MGFYLAFIPKFPNALGILKHYDKNRSCMKSDKVFDHFKNDSFVYTKILRFASWYVKLELLYCKKNRKNNRLINVVLLTEDTRSSRRFTVCTDHL